MTQNATYQQLMLLPSDELTEGQKTFLTVHNEMLMAGQKAAECFLIVARDMQRMRDEELYRAAGFDTFKDYVETALNIKERQAYNWINVLTLPEEYLTKNAAMGVTKLALIANASGEVAKELMADEETSDKSVRELTALIKEREKELDEKNRQISLLTDELETERERNDNVSEPIEVDVSAYEERIKALSQQLEEANKNLGAATEKLATKEAKIKELKNQPPKVVTETVEKTVDNPETQKALETAQKEADAAKADKVKAEAEAKQYQDELANYKKTQEAVSTFKIYASTLFETFETVLEAVRQIKSADAALAKKCVGKLLVFSDNVKNSVEEMQ